MNVYHGAEGKLQIPGVQRTSFGVWRWERVTQVRKVGLNLGVHRAALMAQRASLDKKTIIIKGKEEGV